jgi:hypothetical protein
MISAKDVKIAITWSQTGLTFLSWIHVVLVVAWAAGALLDGFSNGIFHVTPILYEILLIKFIAETIGFGINAIRQQFAIDTHNKHQMILVVGFLLVIGIIINVTHLVFTGIELEKCESLLCDNNYWFLFIFAFILGILAVIEGIMLWYFIVYDRHLKHFNKFILRAQ